ncbi:MAG: hypothetical protein ACRDJC_25280 [Thermomicrobiales bacterium]
MRAAVFDAFNRRTAASVSRRNSLLTLSGAGLAALLGGPLTADAKKSGKKKKKAFKKCNPQVAQCAAAIQAACDERDTDPDTCAAKIACCDFFGRCNAGGFLSCADAY